MSKRVYEIARELDLSTKEVIDRLNDAGVAVKSHFAVVEDTTYDRVFGDDSDALPNGPSEAQDAEALWRRPQPPRKRSPTRTLSLYIVAAALALAVAAGVGVMAALMMQGDLSLPGGDASRSPGEQENAPRPQQENAAAEQKQEAASQPEREATPQQSETEYVGKVGDVQSTAVETFLDSHDKLLRYDALTADDVEELQANEAALRRLTAQVDDLDPPQRYEDQYKVFRSALNELNEAARVAYDVVADPTTATKSDFDNYDRHAQEAADRLQRSNEILGRDYKTIDGVQEISPL